MKQFGILLWIALGMAAAGLGWVAWQRHESHLRMERAAQISRHPTIGGPADDAGTAVGIAQFYAMPGEIVEGEHHLICYGVRNARSVRLEPRLEELSPSRTRCFSTQPHQDTTYTLIAEGVDGSRVSESFVVRVKPAPPAILMLATSSSRISRGDAVTVCYEAAHASTVRLDPIGWQLPPSAKNCGRFYPKTTASYTLVATGEGGRTDRKAFSVEVR